MASLNSTLSAMYIFNSLRSLMPLTHCLLIYIVCRDTGYLQAQWDGFFEASEHPSLSLALVLFSWYEIVFYGRYLPFLLCDHIPFFRQYKIQTVISCPMEGRV
jgi:hypothetical protein